MCRLSRWLLRFVSLGVQTVCLGVEIIHVPVCIICTVCRFCLGSLPGCVDWRLDYADYFPGYLDYLSRCRECLSSCPGSLHGQSDCSESRSEYLDCLPCCLNDIASRFDGLNCLFERLYNLLHRLHCLLTYGDYLSQYLVCLIDFLILHCNCPETLLGCLNCLFDCHESFSMCLDLNCLLGCFKCSQMSRRFVRVLRLSSLSRKSVRGSWSELGPCTIVRALM